jgi:hypothetical protein
MGHVNSPASLSPLSDMSTGSDSSSSSGEDAGKWPAGDWQHNHGGGLDTVTELPELASFASDAFSESESDNENFHSGSDDFDSDLLEFDSDADDELSDYGSSENDNFGEPINSDKWARLRKWVLEQLSEMYARRYFLFRTC